MQQAYHANEMPKRINVTYPLVTCLEWNVSQQEFSVAADLGQIVSANGPGVYTLAVWAPMDRKDGRVSVSKYSIFVKPNDTPNDLRTWEDRK